MFIPYRVDVTIRRWPIANFIILGLLIVCYMIERAQLPNHIDRLMPFVLAKGQQNLPGLVGYIFLHGDILHLAGNLLFLWVFGNAVCVKVGNLAYPFIFLALGVVAGILHLSLGGMPAIGASGAINGIVGMFLVWFPMNNVSLFYIWFFRIGTFEIRSYWIILIWLAFDLLGAALGPGNVAYWVHVGGFAAGFGLAVLLVKLGRVRMETGERSLLQPWQSEKDVDDELGPVAPIRAAALAVPMSAPVAISLAPPEGYFVSFDCACGAPLRAPRKRAGEDCTCLRCSARTKIPAL